MAREIRRNTLNPLATAMAIDLIHGYAEGVEPETRTERAVHNVLKRKDPQRKISRRMTANFAAVPQKIKTQTFGDIAPGRLRRASDAEVTIAFSQNILPVSFRDDVHPPEEPNYPAQTVFTVSYTGLYCKDGTGDRGIFGSRDEPYVISSAVHVDENGENIVRSELHPVGDNDKRYGGMEDGKWRSGPIAACWVGTAKEVSIVTVVMEHDEGDPDAYREEVEAVIEVAAAIAAANGIPVPDAVKSLVASIIIWVIGSSDDEVGTETIVLNPRWLKLSAPAIKPTFSESRTVLRPVGFMQFIEETVTDQTDIPYSFISRHDDDGEYVVCYRITADRDPTTSPAITDVAFNGDVGRLAFATRRN